MFYSHFLIFLLSRRSRSHRWYIRKIIIITITIITETENKEDQLWWEVKRRNNIPGGRRSRCGKFNVNWELQRSKSKAYCQIQVDQLVCLRFDLFSTFKYRLNQLYLAEFNRSKLLLMGGVTGMEIRQTTFVLQSITFIDKLLSERLILLGRGGHRTQKGHGLLYDFVKPGRRNNTNKVSLSNVITQTHPKITSRLLPTLNSNAILRVR